MRNFGSFGNVKVFSVFVYISTYIEVEETESLKITAGVLKEPYHM